MYSIDKLYSSDSGYDKTIISFDLSAFTSNTKGWLQISSTVVYVDLAIKKNKINKSTILIQ